MSGPCYYAIYACAVTSKRMRISSSTTSVPRATLNGLKPSSDCLSGNSPLRDQRAVLALDRHGHAHIAHLVLDRDFDADVEALARRDDIGGAQADRRIMLAVQQRLRQQVLARAVTRALRHAWRKIRAGLLAHRRFVDGELVHRESGCRSASAWRRR